MKLPPELLRFLGTDDVIDRSGHSPAKVFETGKGYFVKCDEPGELAREFQMTQLFYEMGFGPEAVLYLSGYMIAFNILTWTHGLVEITGRTSLKQAAKGLMSPTVICSVIGIAAFFWQIPMEKHVMQAISYIGAMNTPMGMIVTGCVLAETGLAGVRKRPRLFFVTLIKLVIAPLVTCLLLILARKIVWFDDSLFYAMLIPSACPTATTATMMALRYDRDYEYSNQEVVISTLLSLVTIPLMAGAARFFAG
jgi:predicted permease